MKRSVYLSLIKELTLEIKDEKYNLILLNQRGFIHLQNKNYQEAIEDFNTVIYRNAQMNTGEWIPSGKDISFLQKTILYKTYLYRSLAFALTDDLDKSGYDYSYLLRSNCEMEYPYFIFFTWAVLKQDTYQAIRRYSNFRSYAKELMDFEEDIFNLLPIENIEGLNESIKLIDFSLGIVRKNRN